jgi:hypothetical protein
LRLAPERGAFADTEDGSLVLHSGGDLPDHGMQAIGGIAAAGDDARGE